jgi:hypothetical protein
MKTLQERMLDCYMDSYVALYKAAINLCKTQDDIDMLSAVRKEKEQAMTEVYKAYDEEKAQNDHH